MDSYMPYLQLSNMMVEHDYPIFGINPVRDPNFNDALDSVTRSMGGLYTIDSECREMLRWPVEESSDMKQSDDTTVVVFLSDDHCMNPYCNRLTCRDQHSPR